MTSPGFHNLPSEDQPQVEFHQGDMALVLRADGTVEPLAFGIDTKALSGDVEKMDEETLDTLLRSQNIFALCVAAQSETLMELLREVAASPEVIDLEAIRKMVIQ